MELEVFIAPSARREDGLREEKRAWTCVHLVWFSTILGVTGLEPATRGRSKHQVRRVASGVGTLVRLASRRHEMISRVEMVDHLQQCARRDASDPCDAVSRRPGQRRALEQTGRNSIAFVAFLLGPSAPVACSHWVDGVSRLRLLAKDRPDSGLLVAHLAENDAYPYLACSQSGTLYAHILYWAKSTPKRTPPGACTSRHAHMPATSQRALTMPRAEGCRCRC